MFLLGRPCWIYRYNGPNNHNDWATTVTVGADGNIYAGGISEGYVTNLDQVIVSLQPDGDTNWTYRFDTLRCDDRCNHIMYGGDGDIYSAGDFSDSAYGLIVQDFSSAGARNWTYTSEFYGTCYALDYHDGTIYGAGNIGGGYAVFSVDSSGSENWQFLLYNNWGGGEAKSITYGTGDKVYSAGYTTVDSTQYPCFTVVCHNLDDGYHAWIDNAFYGKASKIICGGDGYIYAMGTLRDSAAVRKYTPFGTRMWTRRFDASLRDMVYGNDGNIYLAGSTMYGAIDEDLIVYSLTPGNILNWTFRYWDFDTSRANTIVYGQDDKIYVGGLITGTDSSDAFILCLSADGDSEWSYQYNGTGHGRDCITDIAFGPDHRIYAAGQSTGAGTRADFIVMSMDTLAINELNSEPCTHGNVMTVSPNPCSRSIKISLNLSEMDQPISLNLYDITGRLVGKIWTGQADGAPIIKYAIPTGLADGVYYIILKTVADQYLGKIIVAQ